MSETVRENHGICCPKCGSDDQIDVCANVWVRLCDNGTDAYESENGDQEWDDDSPCSCNVCDYDGTVGSFAINPDFEQFVTDYIACALWSSNDESDINGDMSASLDENYGPEDIAPGTMEHIRTDCAIFYNAYSGIIRLRAGQAGHDFWLTRNGHGAGFWDGDWAEPFATMLSEASRAAGPYTLYVGDDGTIYGDAT